MDANSAEEWDRIWRQEGTRSWRRLMAPVHTWLLDSVSGAVGRRPGRSLLELGPGLGFLLERAHKRSWKAYAIDISPVAVARCRELCVEAEVADLRQEQLDPYLARWSPHCVIASEFIEHLPYDARCKVLSSVAGAGIPLALSVPDSRLGPDEEPQHHVMYSAETLESELNEHCSIVRIAPINGYLCALTMG